MSSPISGFTAIPNPQMLAFMPIQSYLMMYFAGSAWQFGKRKISAKSNEEFNKLTMKTLLEEHTMELKSVIPTLEKSLNDVTPLIRILIEQYGDFIREAFGALEGAIGNIFQGTSQTSGQGSDIFGVRYDPGAFRGQDLQNTKDYWRKVAEDAWRKAGEIKGPAQPMPSTFGTTHARFGHPGHPLHQAPKTSPLPKPQIAKTNLTGKKNAGQSQLMERKRLIQEILKWTKFLQVPSQSQSWSAKGNLEGARQRLVNLLTRYRF